MLFKIFIIIIFCVFLDPDDADGLLLLALRLHRVSPVPNPLFRSFLARCSHCLPQEAVRRQRHNGNASPLSQRVRRERIVRAARRHLFRQGTRRLAENQRGAGEHGDCRDEEDQLVALCSEVPFLNLKTELLNGVLFF